MCYTQHKVCTARAPCNQPTDQPTDRPTKTPLRTHNNDRGTGRARGAALRLIADHGQTQCACCPDTQGARQREPSLTSTQPSRSSRPGWPWSVRWPRFAGRQDVKNAGSKRHTRQVPVWLQAVGGGGGRASRVSSGRERKRESSPSGPADAEVPHPDSSCLRLRLVLLLRRRGTHVSAPEFLVTSQS